MKPTAAVVSYVDPESQQFYVLDFDIVTSEEHDVSASVTTHPVQEGANITDHVRPDLKRLNLKVRVSDSPINNVTTGVSPRPLLGTRASVVLEGLASKQETTFQVTGGYPPLTLPNGVPFVSGLSVPTLGGQRPFVEPRVTPGSQTYALTTVNWPYLKFPESMARVKTVWQVLQFLCLDGIPVEVNSDLNHYPRMLITQLGAPRDGTTGQEISRSLQELRTARTSRTNLSIKAAKPKEKRAEKPVFQGKKGTPIRLKTKTSLAHQAQDLALGR